MPRRLIIGILILLIVGIVGGTVAIVLQRLQGPTTGTPVAEVPDTLTPADTGNQQLANPTADDDTDGLTNAEELVWGTDSTNPDTDGDGYEDGEEVAANHNPTVAAPNDLLPANFQPGQNLQPLEEAPLEVDQFFEEGLVVTADPANFTEEYNQRYPEAERTQETLVAFAKEKPIITKLPTIRGSAITTTQQDSRLTIGHYLDTAGNVDALINRTVMSHALNDLLNGNDASSVYGLAVAVKAHQQVVAELPVPPAAVPLHKILIGFSELLSATYAQMAGYNGDPVKAMVAVHQLDTIDRQYTPLILSEIARLEALQDSAEQTE